MPLPCLRPCSELKPCLSPCLPASLCYQAISQLPRGGDTEGGKAGTGGGAGAPRWPPCIPPLLHPALSGPSPHPRGSLWNQAAHTRDSPLQAVDTHVRIIVHCGDQVLHQCLQGSRDEASILEDEVPGATGPTSSLPHAGWHLSTTARPEYAGEDGGRLGHSFLGEKTRPNMKGTPPGPPQACMLETPQWVPERHPHQGQGVGIRYQLGLAGSWVAPQLLFCASQASLQGLEHLSGR